MKNTRWAVLIFTVIFGAMALCGGCLYIAHNYDLYASSEYGAIFLSQIPIGVRVVTYILASMLALYLIWRLVIFAFACFKKESRERAILWFSLPILVVLIYFVYTEALSYGGMEKAFFYGDEYNIMCGAIVGYPFTFVYTSFAFLVGIFMFPFRYGPLLLKLLLTAYVSGYVLDNTWTLYHEKLYIGMEYALFLSSTYLSMGVRTHRMHWFALVYIYIYIFFFTLLERIKNTHLDSLKQ